MFYSRTPREIKPQKTATDNIEIGQYDNGESTLKPLQKQILHNYTEKVDKVTQNYITEIQKKAQQVPAVGSYDPKEPQYIRMGPEQSAVFSSNQTRFYVKPKIIPGPGEYCNDMYPLASAIEKKQSKTNNQTTPHIIREIVQDEDKVQSIPYKKPDATDSPSPVDYNPTKKVEYPMQTENNIIPAGGMGGSYLLRTAHKSPWNTAPEREILKPTVSAPTGPGSYDLKRYTGLKEENKMSNAFQHKYDDRFNYMTNGINIDSLSLQYEGNKNTIENKQVRINQSKQNQQQQQIEREQTEKMQQTLHPTIHPVRILKVEKEQIGYLNAAEQHNLKNNNPAVGIYNIQQNKNYDKQNSSKKSIEAQVKMALAQQVGVDKWGDCQQSIPQLDREVLPQRNFVKPESRCQMELQTERNLQKMSVSKTTKLLGPGSYNVEQSYKETTGQKNFNINASANFTGNNQRDVFNHQIRENEKDQILMEQKRRKYIEEQKEQRQVGGESTVISYNMAKCQNGENQIYNQSRCERDYYQTTLDPKQIKYPGVGVYDIGELQQLKNNRKLDPLICKYERLNSYQINVEQLPEVLKNSDQIGPGAERALQVIAQRRAQGQIVCSNTYQQKVNKPIKTSFNSLCDENRVE